MLMTSVLLCILNKFSVGIARGYAWALMLCKILVAVQSRGKSVGVVSKDSVTAWLLVPRTGPTQSWMKKSEPGQVFAVVKMDSKNRGIPKHKVG